MVYKSLTKMRDARLNLSSYFEKQMEERTQVVNTTGSLDNPRRILVVGNHEYILKNVETILRKAGYETAGSTEVEEALEYIRQNTPDAVLIGGGVDPHVRMRIRELVSKEYSTVRVIEHFGGPATILSEVEAVLRQQV